MDESNDAENLELPNPDGVGDEGNSDPPHRDESLARRRHKRIQDHRREGLGNASTLAAGVSCTNADLMEVEMAIAAALLKDIRRRPINAGDLDEMQSSLNLLFRCTKQVAQLSQLELQLGNNNPPPPPPRQERPSEET